MPDRVDARINGIRPTLARGEDLQANRTAQAARDAGPRQANNAADRADRVEISDAARARNQELAAANAGEGAQRGAAANAAGAREPEAGEQGNVDRATEQNAQRLREEQEADRQQAANRPPERSGTLVDVEA